MDRIDGINRLGKKRGRKIMTKFIKVPDGIIRADLIKRVTKYERDSYTGGKYYGVLVEEETNHRYEKLDRGGVWSNSQEQWRNEIYNDIVKQLSECEGKEVEKDEYRRSNKNINKC